MTTTDPDLDLEPDRQDQQRERALPKWAQDLLRNLRQRIASAERDLETMTSAVAPGGADRIIADPHLRRLSLPSAWRIRFQLWDEHGRDTSVDAWVEDGRVRLMGRGGMLAVRPQAANVVALEVVDRG